MDFGTREHLGEKNGHLIIGGADVVELARKHGTPLYVTDETRIRSNYRRFAADSLMRMYTTPQRRMVT